MLSRTNQFVIGIFITLVLLAGLFLLYRTSLPLESEISQRVEQLNIKPIDKNVIDSSLEAKLNQKTIHGNIPVTVDEGEQGRDNPFSDF